MGLAASYAGRLGLTAWRRKSTLLGVAAGLVLLILCLQYNAASRADPAPMAAEKKAEDGQQEPTSGDDKSPLQRTLRNHQESSVDKFNLHRLPDPEGDGNDIEEDRNSLKQNGIVGESVKFVQSDPKAEVVTLAPNDLAAQKNQFFSKAILSMVRIPEEQPAREEVGARKQAMEQYNGEGQRAVVEVSTPAVQPVLQYNSYDQQGLYQMGIPYVNLDPRRPYVPEQRLVHFDLKGAPPK
ncbi:hypothetical protein L9F63_025286, partial [Diploptera punctata]